MTRPIPPILPVPPNLPLAPNDYDRRFVDQLNNVLRLFFNQLTGLNRSLIANITAPSPPFLYAYTTGTLSIATTATAVTSTTITGNSNFTQGSPASRFIAGVTGYYTVTSEGYVSFPSTYTGVVYLWLRVNGADITNSASVIQTAHAIANYASLENEVTTLLNVGDYVEVMYGATLAGASFTSTASTAFAPASPCMTINIAYASV